MRFFPQYVLWQVPGWLIAGVVVAWLASEFGLAMWVAVTALMLIIARDLAMYLVLRPAFAKPPYGSAPIGAAGETVEPLAPAGYVRVNGELWPARAVSAAADVPRGARVVVRDVHGITLLVEPSAAPGPERGREPA